MLTASSSNGMLSSTILITAATAIYQIIWLLGSFIHFNTYIQGTGQNNLRQCAWSREGILPSARPWPTGFLWAPPGRPRWSAWSPPPCSAGTAPSQPKCKVDSVVSKLWVTLITSEIFWKVSWLSSTLCSHSVTFLNIWAITPLGAAPASFAQQCPRCDNSSSEVGLHKIPCTWGELSTAWANCGDPIPSHISGQSRRK